MQYFQVKPEVPGGLGEGTVMDSSVHPPKVYTLNYEFDGWPTDVLLTSFPCYIVTEMAKRSLEGLPASGASFSPVAVSKSETFDELFPGKKLPDFWWMKVVGVAGKDDFGIAPNLRLVVSRRALDVLGQLGLSEAIVTACE